MKDIKDYLEQTNTVLLTKDAFEYLKERASVLDKIRTEIEQIDIFMGVADYPFIPKKLVLYIIDKYTAESEDKE